MRRYDAVVVGSGPNGLAAAIALARAGRSVLVREAAEVAGGGLRTEALTLPGFVHDVCSAVHPMAVVSPFLSALPLQEHGLRWIHPPSALAHPLDGGRAALMHPSLEETARGLGADEEAYRSLYEPFVRRWRDLLDDVLQPLVHRPRHPILLARFGMKALLPAETLALARFRTEEGRALFAGIASHASVPLSWPGSSAVAMMLAVAGHARGWPIPEGGAGSLARAMIAYLKSLGAEIQTGAPVRSLTDLPGSARVFLDLTPRQVADVAGEALPAAYVRRLRAYRYGPGVFKMDFALSGPIPWSAPECLRSATVHVCGGLDEMVESERAPVQGRVSERPYVLLSQPTLFDPARAPEGRHVVWAYCHVPNGSREDMSGRIESQIERFAPGFRGRILARHAMGPRELEAHDANLVGGDIAGGLTSLAQLLRRPVASPNPYATPNPRVWICSSSTPPGSGVHGMCGANAVAAALSGERRRGA